MERSIAGTGIGVSKGDTRKFSLWLIYPCIRTGGWCPRKKGTLAHET